MGVPKSDPHNMWLEPVLRRGLRRVAAPAELLDRVTFSRLQMRAEPGRTFMSVIAGASVVTASLLAVAWGYYPSQRVDFRSNEAAGREASTFSAERPNETRVACLACHLGAAI